MPPLRIGMRRGHPAIQGQSSSSVHKSDTAVKQARARLPRRRVIPCRTLLGHRPSASRNTRHPIKGNTGEFMSYQAEYIWIDGTEPTPLLAEQDQDRRRRQGARRSGASTARARTRPRADDSDCVLQPVFVCPDPLRAEGDKLVMCEVLHTDMTPAHDQHPSQVRRVGREVRRPGAVVRDRAGVHLLPVRPPPGLARESGSRPRRARTTAASVATRCRAGRSSSGTRRRA